MSEDLLVDGYDYNPHTCMVEVPYNDYWDMKDKCKENKQLKSQLQQKENIIKEVREYIESYNLEYLHETNEHNLADILEELLAILDKENI